jgi:PAS domain-containing protein
MICYYELSVMTRTVYGICIMLLAVIAVFLLIVSFVLDMERWYRLAAAILVIGVMYVFQGISDVSCNLEKGNPLSFFSRIIGNLSSVKVLALLILAAGIEIIFILILYHSKKNVLTSGAVKESLDALPDGVCFSDMDGQPLLVNTQMQRISGELFHTEILNAELFLDNLKSVNHEEGDDPAIVATTKDGKVWHFHQNVLQVRQSGIQELVANDVTEQYCLSQELKKRNKSLAQINERLQLYSREVERVTREKEILTAKVHVHDDVGRSLLAFRSYLVQSPEKRNREELLLLWRHTVAVMRNEIDSFQQTDEWKLLMKAAEAVDVEIIKDGELPEDKGRREILIAVIHECLTNTVKHANGNRLYLSVRSEETAVIAELTNNGKQPSEQIKETGGLKNIRYTVEAAGGAMTIKSTPRFMLQVELPKGEEY